MLDDPLRQPTFGWGIAFSESRMRHAGPVVFVAPSPAGALVPNPDEARVVVVEDEGDPEQRFVQALLRVRAAKRRRAGEPRSGDEPKAP